MEDLKFTQVSLVKTYKQKLNGLVAGTDKGTLLIFSYPLNDRVLDQISVHTGEVTKVIVSPDNRYVFSAGSDGTLFIFQVSEQSIMLEGQGMG